MLPVTNRQQAAMTAEILLHRAGVDFELLMVEDDVKGGPIAIWNHCAARLACNFLVYLAQDAFPGRAWLAVALDAMKKAPGAGLFAFNDGKWFGQLASFGLVRLSWLNGIYHGPLFFEGYQQHYGDTELTLIAKEQQALVYQPHAVLIEVDHSKDMKPVAAADRALFAMRCRNGFDGKVRNQSLLGMFV